MTIAPQPLKWRSIALPVLLPTLLFSTGEGAIIPIIPLAADSLGASLAIAGLIAALLTLGELFGNIPSGWVISRVGERPAMIGAAVLSMIGMAACLVAQNLIVLGVGILLAGLGAAVFGLARHAFMTSFVPLAYRARALSTLGGTFRAGFFIGPFITAAVVHVTGTTGAAFGIHVVACLGAAIILLTLRDPTASFGAIATVRLDGRELSAGEAEAQEESSGLFRTIARSRGMLGRLGLGITVLSALRASRQVILPLWAVSIGVSATNTALIIGVAGAVDFALFYVGGQIMDRFGRLWAAVPSLVGLAVGHILLALAHDSSANLGWFIFAAMFLSVANGPGSGIVMTIGSDLADPRDPAPFLGAWRFTANLGGAAAPLAIAGITAAASLAIAAGAIGVIGMLGAVAITRYLPRYLPTERAPRA